ncbi:MAG: hypothetical protein JWR19_3940 [Pedosphaera sp.]|jgi:hypothetical protein|nr:hypothetical protein [Pedosphaera sp.]
MKNINKLMLAAAVAASFALANRASADDHILLSPRAQANRVSTLSTAKVTTTESKAQVAPSQATPVGSPRMQSLKLDRAIGDSKNDVDLVRQQRELVYTGRNPTRDTQVRQFEVAPLK